MLRRTITLEGPAAKRSRQKAARRTGMRKSKIARMFRNTRAVHAFERRCSFVCVLNNTNGWTSGAVVSQSMQMYFTLQGTAVYFGGTPLSTLNMPYADFTSLFDEYKIVSVKTQIFAGFNTSTLNANPNLPVCFIIPDYDDVNALTSTANALEYQSARPVTLGRDTLLGGITHTVKPKVQIQTYRTALTTGYSAKAGQWIDCDQSDVPHYGLKLWLDPLYGGGTDFGRVEFVWTYRILCRSVR